MLETFLTDYQKSLNYLNGIMIKELQEINRETGIMFKQMELTEESIITSARLGGSSLAPPFQLYKTLDKLKGKKLKHCFTPYYCTDNSEINPMYRKDVCTDSCNSGIQPSASTGPTLAFKSYINSEGFGTLGLFPTDWGAYIITDSSRFMKRWQILTSSVSNHPPKKVYFLVLLSNINKPQSINLALRGFYVAYLRDFPGLTRKTVLNANRYLEEVAKTAYNRIMYKDLVIR